MPQPRPPSAPRRPAPASRGSGWSRTRACRSGAPCRASSSRRETDSARSRPHLADGTDASLRPPNPSVSGRDPARLVPVLPRPTEPLLALRLPHRPPATYPHTEAFIVSPQGGSRSAVPRQPEWRSDREPHPPDGPSPARQQGNRFATSAGRVSTRRPDTTQRPLAFCLPFGSRTACRPAGTETGIAAPTGLASWHSKPSGSRGCLWLDTPHPSRLRQSWR